ncbi:hypothetical protein pdul_cds_955 [Pandoravirus dulcis]|uniref:Uncharacterized protein n=1 Tax=Pandoravirus dulcis TaxID=1349409 RepID=S4VYQ7_9VIRU|nr:hypothetical protein pdul_cds_955 [Pandoravirus dulcis]AGO83206.1 hypothetical protein pdul_cds_955 [Pandoravirus dulcis]
MEQLALSRRVDERDVRAAPTGACSGSVGSRASRKRRALAHSEPAHQRARRHTDNVPALEDRTVSADAATTPMVCADRGLAATSPLHVRHRAPRRLHPMARIIQRTTQYVCVGGRQLAVVDVAIALVIQAAQAKPGSCDTLLAQSWSLQDSALAVHGMCAHPGSVVVLTAAVAAPASAPPPFIGAMPSRPSERASLAYTRAGLFWLFGALRSHGDPRLYAAMGAIVRSGVLDAIGARLELAPATARAPSPTRGRAAANVTIALVDDRRHTDTAAAAAAASPDDLGRRPDDGDNSGSDDKNDDASTTASDSGVSVCVLSVAAAAMRNELCGVDPWAIMGQGDRRRVVGSDAREACALLAATGACLARSGVAARLFVDAAPGPRVDDARFRHHVEAAFGFVAP